MLASGTQDRGFAPGRSRRIFRAKKILNMPSFGREVELFAPCRRFSACKRSLNGVKRRHFGKITGPLSPKFPPFATRSARVFGNVEASGSESGNSKGRVQQWQTTPRNLPRMQRARTIPVAYWALVPAKPAQGLNTNKHKVQGLLPPSENSIAVINNSNYNNNNAMACNIYRLLIR
jgi:hypothetical protein